MRGVNGFDTVGQTGRAGAGAGAGVVVGAGVGVGEGGGTPGGTWSVMAYAWETSGLHPPVTPTTPPAAPASAMATATAATRFTCCPLPPDHVRPSAPSRTGSATVDPGAPSWIGTRRLSSARTIEVGGAPRSVTSRLAADTAFGPRERMAG